MQHAARVAKEKEEAEKRAAKLAHKAARLAAAEKTGVAAPKRLKRKAKKGVRLRKHVVVRVRARAGWLAAVAAGPGLPPAAAVEGGNGGRGPGRAHADESSSGGRGGWPAARPSFAVPAAPAARVLLLIGGRCTC